MEMINFMSYTEAWILMVRILGTTACILHKLIQYYLQVFSLSSTIQFKKLFSESET